MSLWIASFIVGQLLGGSGFFSVRLISVGVELSTLFLLLLAVGLTALPQILGNVPKLRFISQSVCVAIGIFQGGISSAPTPVEAIKTAQVVQTNPFHSGRRAVIASAFSKASGKHTFYQAISKCAEGQWGALSSRPTVGLLDRHRASFKPGILEECQQEINFQSYAKGWVAERFAAAKVPSEDANLIKGFLWGDEKVKFGKWRQIFLRSGVFHLLVTSGLHVTLVAHFCSLVCILPTRFLYIGRLINPGMYRHLSYTVTICASILAYLYASFSGPSAAAQRAALIFVTGQLTALFGLSWSLGSRLRTAAFLQTLLYPVGFVGLGSLLSWTVYLIVMTSFQKGHGRPRAHGKVGRYSKKFFRSAFGCLLRAQIEVTIVTVAVFGHLSIPGLAANLLLIPVFPPILLTSGLTVVAPTEVIPALLTFLRTFVEFVRYFSESCNLANWLCSAPRGGPTLFRQVALIATAIIFLNKSRELTIGH